MGPQLFYFNKFLFICKTIGNHTVSSQEKFLKNGINQKESDAWKELYRYFYGTLCNYTTKIVVDETVAEDIVQECFISIWNSSLHFQEMKALSVYLYRSVHNNALKYLRDKNVDNQRLQRWSKEQDDVEDVDFYQAVEEELIRKLHVVIDQLPEQRKNILLLSIDGLTVQEIADQLNISINTVKTQKKRAYVFLKENLKQSLLLIYILEILK